MKTGHLLLMIALLLFAAASAAFASDVVTKEVLTVSHISSPNLVPNAGFEDASGGLPAGWAPKSPRPEIAPAFSSDSAMARTGQRSLRISGDGKPGVAGWITATCSGIRAGASYELTAYFRTEDIPDPDESVWVYIGWRKDASDDRARAAYLHSPVCEGDWWRISGTLRAPADATLADVTLGLRFAPHGRVWFDDVALREVPSPAPRRVRIATAYLNRETRGPEAWRKVIEEAGQGKADIVCLGELAQIVPDDPASRPTIPGPATDVLGELARKYHMMIVVSLPEWQGNVRYNTAVLVGRDGGIIGKYRKVMLPEAEVEWGTAPGSELPVFDTDIGRIGMQICYDHVFPEISRSLALQGAEIIFTPIEGDIRTEGKAYDAVARARALDNSVYYVTSICDTGRSLIIDPSGQILADTAGKLGLVFADVDLDAEFYEPWLSVPGYAEFKHVWPKERRPAMYHRLTARADPAPNLPSEQSSMTASEDIRTFIANTDEQEMRGNLFYLSKDPLPFRKANFTRPGQTKSTIEEADDFICGKLKSWGYQPELEPVQAQAFRCDRTKPRHHWYATPDPSDPWYTLHNIWAKKRGATKPEEIIVVVSHKDSPSWIDSPGAHDNAIGTVGNLELARLLSGRETQRSIWFLYCNEEHRPWTSIAAAQNAKSRRDNIIAVFNLDGIGARPQEAIDAGRRTSAVLYTTNEGKELADLMMAMNQAYGIGLDQYTVRVESPSNDDGSFIKAGYPAALGVHGSSPYGDPNYHEAGDIPERVDIVNARMAAQVTLATILTLDAQ